LSASHSAAGVNGRDDAAVGFLQHAFIVPEPRRQPPPGPRLHALRGRKAFATLLKALDAEKLTADGLFGDP
jgi:hypothetical protein